MVDEATTEAPVTTEATTEVPVATEVTTATTNFFGADGVLNEGWRGTLEEDLREDKTLMSFKNVGDLAKSYVNARGMIGKNTVAVLNDASTPSEIEAYHEGGGRPKTVADYDLKMPDGFPEELTAKLFPEGEMDKWKARMFKGGVSQNAANELVQDFAKDVLVSQQAMSQATEAAKAEVMTKLTTEYGAAFDQKMHMGDMAIEDFTDGDVEMKEALAHLRKDPLAIRMMAHFGEMLAEGKPPGFAAIPTPSDHQDQIDALRADPRFNGPDKRQRMKIANKILELKKLQMPEPATA